MRRIVNDISNGKNLSENLKKYVSGIKKIHNKYAFVRLALNYYTYYQIDFDQDTKRERQKEMADEVNHIIRDALLGQEMNAQEAVEKLNGNREVLLKMVSALTYYVDVFKTYEHALNRVEYRFREDDFPKGYSDEELCRMLMQYIVSDEDSVVVNSKISEIMAELPIRMTKAKFFEYLSNGLSIYKGSDKKTLDDFLYMIETSAMILKKEEYGEIFPELEETLASFQNVDYGKIEKEEYHMLIRSIEDVSVYLEDVMNISMMLMEIMNDTYSLLLTKENTECDKVMTACNEIVAAVNDYFILGSGIAEETEDLFVMLEGSQESLYSKLSMYNILDEINQSYQAEIEENGLTAEYAVLAKLEILSSDSLFVELETNVDDRIVDEDILEEEKQKLIEEFKILFAKMERI